MANSPYSLFSLRAAGPSLTGSASAASMLVAASPAAGQVRPTIQPLWLAYGSMMTWDSWGILSTAASSPGTGTWDIRLGSVVVFNSTAGPTFPVSESSWKWHFHLDLELRSEGVTTAAQFWGQGYLALAATATTDQLNQVVYNATPALGTGFDSTIANVLDSFYTPSVTTQTLVCEMARCILWNPSF